MMHLYCRIYVVVASRDRLVLDFGVIVAIQRIGQSNDWVLHAIR